MDPDLVKLTLQTLAFGNVMAAAARDYQKGLKTEIPNTLVIANCEIVKPRVAATEHITQYQYILIFNKQHVLRNFRQYFIDFDDIVSEKVVVQKNGPRGVHFQRAGPAKVSDQVCACVITCGGLCPGLNTMIREIVCALHHMEDTKLTTFKIVVYIIGGDGTQKGAAVIYEEIRRRGIKAVVVRIPKTIDNDISVIDRESRKRHRSSQINSALQRVHCNVCNSCKS
ncbi:unnamed protein product [Lactuca virosa]|uniref:Phosphofructokinase domain-containing protein n=1 Tax=Lactuca virosa TaxID=75947 RepID=A0AAU9MZD8_9ASTR|nr:unnamed protein product [Lactuca virosa]